MDKSLTLLFLLITFLGASFSKNELLLESPLLIRFQDEVDGAAFINKFTPAARKHHQLKLGRQVSKLLNIYQLQYSKTTDVTQLMNSLKSHRQVRSIGYDKPATYREVTPNDELYNRQWNLEKINLPKVWEETTGGTTINGDQIVIAVLEKGITIDHPDIIDNIWKNEAEIPNNGIDEDGNGYIDDYQGLNLEDLTDQHPVLQHGTQVTGIIAASTNNDIGIAGINWNAKVLFLSSVDFTSEAIEAYEYIYNLRKKYNETNGREGAFIVANNNSFGWDNTRPEELHLGVELCEMYDLMGSVGILSIGAGPNNDVDVDRVGDTPTNCTSNFFIGVTSTNRDDEKSDDGGFGSESIDIGAPGEQIRATSGDDYCNCTGTSFAAPHVTGAIGLLYSIPCQELASDALENAAGTAQFLKDILLEGTEGLASLRNKTISGGRLNVLRSLDNLQVYCGNTGSSELSITTIYPSPSDGLINIEYITQDFEPHQLYVSNVVGQLMYYETVTPPRFSMPNKQLELNGLSKGIYFLTIQRGTQKTTKKFFIQ